MEMTYGGALVMPSSYAMMDEEEMMYVEGGWSVESKSLAKTINIVADVVAIAVGIWSGVGLVTEITRRNAKGLCVAATRLALKYAAVTITDAVLSTVVSLICTICETSLGDIVVGALNKCDKNPSLKYVQF